MKDYIVLVDRENKPLGTMPKFEAHSNKTPLHRGFSLFLFNKNGELLLQQRSKSKKTWPGVWTNSACGHPKLKEAPIEAAKRRLEFELGISKAEIKMILPDYRYRFEKDGIVENEICPVMVAVSDEKIKLNPDEVNDVRWISWKKWLKDIEQKPDYYSPWCVEETKLLNNNSKFTVFLQKISPGI